MYYNIYHNCLILQNIKRYLSKTYQYIKKRIVLLKLNIYCELLPQDFNL